MEKETTQRKVIKRKAGRVNRNLEYNKTKIKDAINLAQMLKKNNVRIIFAAYTTGDEGEIVGAFESYQRAESWCCFNAKNYDKGLQIRKIFMHKK